MYLDYYSSVKNKDKTIRYHFRLGHALVTTNTSTGLQSTH